MWTPAATGSFMVLTQTNQVQVYPFSGGGFGSPQVFNNLIINKNTDGIASVGNFDNGQSPYNGEDIIVSTGNQLNVYAAENGWAQLGLLVSFNYTATKVELHRFVNRAVEYGYYSSNPGLEDVIFVEADHNGQNTSRLHIYPNDNNNGLQGHEMQYCPIDVGSPILDFEVADFGTNGLNDIVVAYGPDGSGNFNAALYRNVQGSFIWGTPVWTLTSNTYLGQDSKIAEADVNKDGLPDLVLYHAGNIYLFLNQGETFNQTPDQTVSVLQSSDNVSQMTCADIYNQGGIALLIGYHNGAAGSYGMKCLNALNFLMKPMPPTMYGDFYFDDTLVVYHPYLHLRAHGERNFYNYQLWKNTPNTGGQDFNVYNEPAFNGNAIDYIDYSESVLDFSDQLRWNSYYYGITEPVSGSQSDHSSHALYELGLQGGCDGCGAGTSSKGKHNVLNIPKEFSFQNYPNPFNPSTQIHFALPRASNVRIRVYSAMGQLVTTLVDSRFDAGYHSVVFDGTNLSSGVYFCRIEAGSFVQSKKMVLLK